MKNRIGLSGILLAVLAVGIAIFQNEIRVATGLSEPATENGGARKTIVLFSRKQAEQGTDVVDYSYMGLGFLALILGVVSFLQKESSRVSGMAAALGLVAVAWQYVLIGVLLAVVILILANMA